MRETITNENKVEGKESKSVTETTSDMKISLTFSTFPLPQEISNFLFQNYKQIDALKSKNNKEEISQFAEKFFESFQESGKKWEKLFPFLWEIGPSENNCNLLFNKVPKFYETPYWEESQSDFFSFFPSTSRHSKIKKIEKNELSDPIIKRNDILLRFVDSIFSGFRLATSSGPLCEEPMMDVCFCLEDFQYNFEIQEDSQIYGPLR